MPKLEIRKQVVLKAPLSRVWRAISDAQQFGSWFGVALDGPFVAGQTLTGKIVPTSVDPDVAKLQEPHRGLPFTIVVGEITPMTRFSFRWHPFGIDKTRDYSAEPMTLVTFALAEVASGTQLTLTETGFDQLPADRRGPAFTANDGGWAHQAVLLGKYLAAHAGS